MDKKKRVELIITAVLIMALVIAWANSINFLRQKSAKPVNNGHQTGSASDIRQPNEAGSIASASNDEKLLWKRCPFSGKVYTSSQPQVRPGSGSVALSGIVWDKEKPTAIINDKIVAPGSLVGGYTVVSIKADRVILSDGSRDFELKIGQ